MHFPTGKLTEWKLNWLYFGRLIIQKSAFHPAEQKLNHLRKLDGFHKNKILSLISPTAKFIDSAYDFYDFPAGLLYMHSRECKN